MKTGLLENSLRTVADDFFILIYSNKHPSIFETVSHYAPLGGNILHYMWEPLVQNLYEGKSLCMTC